MSLHCKIKQWTNHYWTFQSSPKQKKHLGVYYVQRFMGFGHRELMYYFGTILFGREERNPGTPGEQFQFECRMFSDKIWSIYAFMSSLFLVVCMSTYDKIKSCNQQIEYIYPIFIHLLYLNTDLKGYFLNRKRPEVLLWLSLMGSFQIVDVASACVHHDMVSKATILACGNRTSPWTTKPIVFVCISHFQKDDFQCLC